MPGAKSKDSVLDDEKWVNVFMTIINVLVTIYTIITFPIYYFIQQPWLRVEASTKNRTISVTEKSEGPYCHVTSQNPLKLAIDDKVHTLFELYDQLTRHFKDRICFGTREVLDEEDEKQPNGRIFKKLVQGNYNWETYTEVRQRVLSFSQGLRHLGLTKDNNVVIFAETRAEWIIAALACFRYNITVVTLYANLGDDALVHGINETEATLVITNNELLPKFKTLLASTPKVKNVVFMEGLRKEKIEGYPTDVKISTFDEVEKFGCQNPDIDAIVHGSRDDIAIIMYTSGSTGLPKGVMLTHGNIMTVLAGLSAIFRVTDSDIYMAFLPVAHVLELTVEFLCLLNGVPIGYSSPHTLHNASPKVKRGHSGDAAVLQPTFMATVPLILDRIYKAVTDNTSSGSLFMKELFNYSYEYKLYYQRKGYGTPIVDLVIFRKIRNMMGGRLRLVFTGGAPLSCDTHDFIRVCLSETMMQGYGLTETSGAAVMMDMSDQTSGRVGSPLPCCSIMLEDWEEGGYRSTDKPFPRGEILIGGEQVSVGYYKQPEKTSEEFFEKCGQRFFRTGDIGELQSDGCFKIIDRKKDLVKLQFGEYVSLGKVESELKMISLIENICVYGDSSKLYAVALISPNVKVLKVLGKDLGKGMLTVEQLCQDADVEKAVTKMVQDGGKKAKLVKFEIPQKIKLVPETWLPDSGLVTAAYKIKRKNVQDFYQPLIDQMYATS